ncbi:aldose 1-epimerase family protein [Leifsonia shinshuensis]|uniref:Aldose 1-epimerase family protein n=1 Tax=Leifsonia shinshuensis TaxID=150026 RepID=A0A7G6YFC6_9MICO|nr:aldose 1-epimerase family protein [Leifsonia shinshuensis]QNE37191.1 aldose 1-epimerase family protein [Leifsonia shinshuensis]
MRAPTGEQYDLEFGDLTATVTQVAAGLRTLRYGGVDILEPFPEDSTPPSADGIVLMPWPNRVKDGVWELDGVPQRLALTEPALGNASHGLLRHRPYALVERTDSAVTQAATIYPEAGYPFILDTTVTHELDTEGLTVTHTVTNRGERSAPVAIGAHPYLRIGDVPATQLTLTVHAGTRFETDDRLNVTGEAPVAGTRFDLSEGGVVADLDLNDGFGDLRSPVEHVLSAADGRTVTLWGDASFAYVQVFTHRAFATKEAGEVALAVEPMTAPANALNTGQGLRWVEPGETWTAQWGIRPRGFASDSYLASWG